MTTDWKSPLLSSKQETGCTKRNSSEVFDHRVLDYCLSVFLSLSVCLSFSLSLSLSACLSLFVCLSLSLSASLCPSVFVSLSVSVSFSVSLFLSPSLSLCLSLSPSLSLPLPPPPLLPSLCHWSGGRVQTLLSVPSDEREDTESGFFFFYPTDKCKLWPILKTLEPKETRKQS